MINKTTIENRWRSDPNKTYHVIQNPKIDTKTKKIRGLTIKTVPYKVRDWDSKFVNFERIDKNKDKRFPEVLIFDKRYPDATNEVHADRVSSAKSKPKGLDSYAIFEDNDQAEFNKLMRLHKFAESIATLHEHEMKKIQDAKNQGKIYKPKRTTKPDTSKKKETKEQSAKDIKPPEMSTTGGKKGGKKKEVIDLSVDELADIFDAVQDTNYYDRLEELQATRPDLAIM